VEKRVDFREFFNSLEELKETDSRVSRLIVEADHSYEERLKVIEDLIKASQDNPFYYTFLWEFYERRLEIDKAREAAMKMISIAEERGTKEVVLNIYRQKYLKYLDIYNNIK